MNEIKRCSYRHHVGEREVPTSSFYSSRNSRDRLHAWCKDCLYAYGRAHRRKIKARRVERALMWSGAT